MCRTKQENSLLTNVYCFENTLYVNRLHNPNCYLEVFDILGKRMLRAELSNNSQNTFTLNHFASGFYIVKVHNGEEVVSSKIWIKN